jgi:hypothetical protein
MHELFRFQHVEKDAARKQTQQQNILRSRPSVIHVILKTPENIHVLMFFSRKPSKGALGTGCPTSHIGRQDRDLIVADC